MRYNNIKNAVFVNRPNRFIANIILDGEPVVAHVKNTGRCKELLLPENEIYVQMSDNPDRKTPCDIIAVKKGDKIINMDSQAPNKVYFEYIQNTGIDYLKPESVYKNSRFDFYIENNGIKKYVEVKGVTLEENGVALFPDAPTERGIKHIKELCDCVKSGYEAEIFFVIQMNGISSFSPNTKTHPQFSEVLIEAEKTGVKISAAQCLVTPESLEIADFVKVIL